MIHDKHRQWLDQRGGLSEAAEKMGVSSVNLHGKNWLCLPYRLDGELVNRKYRLTSEKQHRMDKGGKLCLWNAECLAASPREVIITEGEFDALAAMACGYSNVVSVPNGGTEHDEETLGNVNLKYLYESEAALAKVGTFILATDSDRTGKILRKELTAVLGPERCKFVEYPEGCKDLNDVLVKHGTSKVVSVLTAAKPMPVKGLYRMSDFPDMPEVQSMRTGIAGLDDYMRIALGTMTVFSGYSNMGKSTVINTIAAYVMANGQSVCVASFETMPRPILRDQLAHALSGDGDYSPDEAREIVEEKLTIVSNALDDDTEIDLDYYLELIRIAVVRDGVRIVILDPWNELEHKRRRDETETDYIGRAIRKLKYFARRYNIALWVVAHPTKPQKGHTGIPSLYDISGSANWANKADYGLIYHRPDKSKNAGTLSVVKVRMGLPGSCGKVPVVLNGKTGRIEHDPYAV